MWISAKLNGRLGAAEVPAVIGDKSLKRQIDFSDQNAVGIAVEHRRASLRSTHEFQADPRCGSDRCLLIAGLGRLIGLDLADCRAALASLISSQRTSIAKAIDATVEPEAQSIEHRYRVPLDCANSDLAAARRKLCR